MKAVEKRHCLLSPVRHTYTRARDASKCGVLLEVLRKPSLAAGAVYESYTTKISGKYIYIYIQDLSIV
jgi:hypothetical protein